MYTGLLQIQYPLFHVGTYARTYVIILYAMYKVNRDGFGEMVLILRQLAPLCKLKWYCESNFLKKILLTLTQFFVVNVNKYMHMLVR